MRIHYGSNGCKRVSEYYKERFRLLLTTYLDKRVCFDIPNFFFDISCVCSRNSCIYKARYHIHYLITTTAFMKEKTIPEIEQKSKYFRLRRPILAPLVKVMRTFSRIHVKINIEQLPLIWTLLRWAFCIANTVQKAVKELESGLNNGGNVFFGRLHERNLD